MLARSRGSAVEEVRDLDPSLSARHRAAAYAGLLGAPAVPLQRDQHAGDQVVGVEQLLTQQAQVAARRARRRVGVGAHPPLRTRG